LRRSSTTKSNSDSEKKVNTIDVLNGSAKVEERHEIARRDTRSALVAKAIEITRLQLKHPAAKPPLGPISGHLAA
jgi:hypothetical protein